MPAAFVTGGSGFVGAALIRRLSADGWTVRALARSAEAEATVREAGAEAVRGDLGDGATLERGVRGSGEGTVDDTNAREQLGYVPITTREHGRTGLQAAAG